MYRPFLVAVLIIQVAGLLFGNHTWADSELGKGHHGSISSLTESRQGGQLVAYRDDGNTFVEVVEIRKDFYRLDVCRLGDTEQSWKCWSDGNDETEDASYEMTKGQLEGYLQFRSLMAYGSRLFVEKLKESAVDLEEHMNQCFENKAVRVLALILGPADLGDYHVSQWGTSQAFICDLVGSFGPNFILGIKVSLEHKIKPVSDSGEWEEALRRLLDGEQIEMTIDDRDFFKQLSEAHKMSRVFDDRLVKERLYMSEIGY